MPRPSLYRLLVSTVLACAGTAVPAQAQSQGAPLIRAYPRQVYGGAGQVFDIAQDSRGLMYFATAPGVVVFDGERWRSTPTEGTLLALATDTEDRLWLAGANRIGNLTADLVGRLEWRGLESQLPESQRTFSDVWPVVPTDRGVFLGAREFLFRYSAGDFTAWPGSVDQIFYRIYDFEGRIFVAQLGVGLLELDAQDQLLLVTDERLDSNAEINAMFDLGAGEFLFFTRLHGVFRLTEEGMQPFEGPASPWLRSHQVQHGCRLPDGRLAIATRRGGVALLDEELEIELILDQQTGLTDNKVAYVTVDRQQNLWVATDDGVNRVHFDTVMAGYGLHAGLAGDSVLSFGSHRDELLVGTSLGLYRGLRGTPSGEISRFEPVAEIESQTWAVLSVEDTLLVATTDGVFEVRIHGGPGVSLTTAQQLSSAAALSLVRSSLEPDIAFAGVSGGLARLRFEQGRWRWVGRIGGIQHDVRQLIEGESGEILALMPDLDQIAILSFPDGLGADPRIVLHDIGYGGIMSRLGDRVILSGDGRFERYLGLQAALAGSAWGPDQVLETLSGDAIGIYLEDRSERLWVVAEGALRLATRTEDGFDLRPVTRQFLELPYEILEDPVLDNVFWLATADGLLRINPRDEEVVRAPTPTLIRRVVRLGDSEVLEGGAARPKGSQLVPPVLDYADNGLRFEFAAPIYDQQTEVLYRVRLDGFSDDWTPWSSEDFKEYSILPEGRYTFRVEAQDAWGAVGPEAAFSFRILPPWYRTPWAYLGYFFVAVGALLAVARLRTWRLERRTRQLEEDVRERTGELADGMQQVARQAKDLERVNALLAEENEHRRLLEIERAKLQARFEQSQKLESLGLMAGGIAHDFNNILTAILGNADLCLDESELPASLERRLRAISEASQRAAELCQQMLAYAGKGRLDERELDLSIITRETLEMLQVSIDAKVQIEIELAVHLPAIIGDATKIRQLVMNLLSNGAEAIGDSPGVLRVTTGTRHLDAADLQKSVLADPVPEGPYVFLRVEDTGDGMDQDTRRRIFDPFFTTKFAGRGLGLAAVLGILRRHAGAIWVTSEPDRGTTFDVFFPALDHSADDQTAPSSDEIRRWRTTGTILVVDDEDIVRDVLTLMLRNTGFEVLAASSGAEALEIFRRDKDVIGAVILDLTMPGLDGLETFAGLRRIDPEIKVILSSGYSGDTLIERYLEQGFAAFMPKPFKVTTLRETLREVLG